MIQFYDNYREWISDRLQQKTLANPLLSVNQIAMRIGLSQSYLSQVLNGKRDLSERMAQKVANYFALKADEIEYLQLLIRKDKASGDIADLYAQKIRLSKEEKSVTDLSFKTFEVMSDWHHSAILEAMLLDGYNGTIEFLVRHLKIDIGVVKRCLETLEDLSLVENSPEGFVRSNRGGLNISSGMRVSGLRRFHTQILKKASQSVEGQESHERILRGMTIAIDPKKLPILEEKVSTFLSEIKALIGNEKKAEVYQVAFQAFRLEGEEQ